MIQITFPSDISHINYGLNLYVTAEEDHDKTINLRQQPYETTDDYFRILDGAKDDIGSKDENKLSDAVGDSIQETIAIVDFLLVIIWIRGRAIFKRMKISLALEWYLNKYISIR